ncbi:MAG TPA: lipopolysaccharide transport periplasmic protein LptA [Casimicrobiaceae bacterium]|nr:lipopolysaccharide transport periplasmic protein LptA [Casimicrobiaceae bacterium]
MSGRLPRHVAAALLVGAALTAVAPARAEKADRDKPINYQADTGDVNVQSKVGTLTGNVILTQGTLTIHADKIVFRQNPDNSVSASAWGNPITFREKEDNSAEYYEGVAQHAEYDGQKRVLELFDRAMLRKGSDEIRSNYISYNAETGLFKAEGRPDARSAGDGETLGARVRGVFQPQPQDGKEPKAAPKPNPPAPLKPDASLSLSPAK